MGIEAIRAALLAGLLAGCVAPPEAGPPALAVVGTVLSTDPLAINGRHLALPPAPEAGAAALSLAPGDVVVVLADPREGEGPSLAARSVMRSVAMTGTVERRRGEGEGLAILGTVVRPVGGIEAPEPGERVAVSGLWRGTSLIATRFEPAPDGPDRILGEVYATADGGRAIGGLRLLPGKAAMLPTPGMRVELRGTREGTGFRVAETVHLPVSDALSGARRLLLEGYLEGGRDGDGGIARLSGLGIFLAPGVQPAYVLRVRSVTEGPVGDAYAAEIGLPLPEDAGQRTLLLSGDAPLATRPGGLPLR